MHYRIIESLCTVHIFTSPIDYVASQPFLPVTRSPNTQITDTMNQKWTAAFSSGEESSLKRIGCCESAAAGNILVCVRQWDGEVGSAVSPRWRWSSGMRSRMTQAEPGPAARGLTAEYTWPGSSRPGRDSWERLFSAAAELI